MGDKSGSEIFFANLREYADKRWWLRPVLAVSIPLSLYSALFDNGLLRVVGAVSALFYAYCLWRIRPSG